MNDSLRERILRKLDALSDERGYHVLDYIEFLESKYAERQSPAANTFTRFTEAIEDKLRAGRVSASTIAETMGFMNRAANVLSNAMETSKTMASELMNTTFGSTPSSGTTGASSSSPPAAPGAASTAHDTKDPGAPGEKL